MNKNLLVAIIISAAAIIIASSGGHRRSQVAGVSIEAGSQKIMGVVLPHHDLARGIIMSTISKIAQTRPNIKYIAVLSPNHFRPQSTTFTTGNKLKDFVIATDKIDMIREKYPDLLVDNALVSLEHGLYVPMTYLAATYPQAQFIPIAVTPFYTTDNLRKMARILYEVLPNDTLLVASTDFSHNHRLSEAMQYDAITIDAIRNFNYQKIAGFNDNNIDSPAAISTVMYALEYNNATIWETWQESHGAIISGNPELVGTSYVTGVFK